MGKLRECSTHLLSVLSNHEDEGEVIHPQSNAEKSLSVDQEDDVLDGLFDHGWI